MCVCFFCLCEVRNVTRRWCFSVNCSVCLQVMLEASLLMMAQGFVQLKQIPRARNVLKRLSRMEWSDTNTEDLENACLLLADMYMKLGKYTLVDKLLSSCIRHNQVCSAHFRFTDGLLFWPNLVKAHTMRRWIQFRSTLLKTFSLEKTTLFVCLSWSN